MARRDQSCLGKDFEAAQKLNNWDGHAAGLSDNRQPFDDTGFYRHEP